MGTADFDPGPGTFELTQNGGFADAFLWKLDSAAGFVWAHQLLGTGLFAANGVAVDASANAYITGFFQATTDFDPGPGAFNLTAAGDSDVFVSKLGVRPFVTDVDSTDDVDTEGGGLTYSLTNDAGGGVDNSLFTLDTATGVLTFTSPPDFETPGDDDTNNDYHVKVTVTDSGGLTDSQDITVTVTDVAD